LNHPHQLKMSAHYSASYSLPMPVPSKGQQYPSGYSGYSVSPPEVDESVASSGGPSYGNSGYSATSSSYAGSSHGDYESNYSASGVDFEDYMQGRFAETFNPLPLDRSMVKQAQA
jgi:biogenesis of lysosome-related organelles complex 1 subunit KXD1